MIEDISLCAVIPSYNHYSELPRITSALNAFNISCIIVDDGNSPPLHERIQETPGVTILRHEQNQGKGAAVITGFRHAANLQFTHALQIDADGQHDLGDLESFITLAKKHPTSLILGTPRFDASAPKIRVWGRKLSVWLVQLETYSRAIVDPLCGYRIYPLVSTLELLKTKSISARMAFDPEIVVYLAWHGAPIQSLSTSVVYPANGTSNFRYLGDNLAMIRLHTRLLYEACKRWLTA